MEDAGDVFGVGHDIEDAHAAAALAADGDIDGEDAGEEAGPADAARSGGGLGGWRVLVAEGEGELLGGGGDDRRWEDARADVMTIGEDAEVAGHVEAGRRHEGAQPGQEFLGGPVGVGGAAATGRLEGDAHAAVVNFRAHQNRSVSASTAAPSTAPSSASIPSIRLCGRGSVLVSSPPRLAPCSYPRQ